MNLVPEILSRCGVCGEQTRLDIDRNPRSHLTAIRCRACGQLTLSMDKFARPLTAAEKAKAS